MKNRKNTQRAHKNWETLGLKFHLMSDMHGISYVLWWFNSTIQLSQLFSRFLTNLIFWSVHQPFADVETYTTESFLLISTLTTVPGLSFI